MHIQLQVFVRPILLSAATLARLAAGSSIVTPTVASGRKHGNTFMKAVVLEVIQSSIICYFKL